MSAVIMRMGWWVLRLALVEPDGGKCDASARGGELSGRRVAAGEGRSMLVGDHCCGDLGLMFLGNIFIIICLIYIIII